MNESKIPGRHPFRSLGILLCVPAFALIAHVPASAAVFIVKNGVADSSKGSLKYMLHRVSEGDSIGFAIAEKDTIQLDSEIVLTKGLSIFGLNAATGNRICLFGYPRVFKLSGGAFKLTNLFMRGKYARSASEYNGAVLWISGSDTRVSLDSVDVRWGLGYSRGGGILNDGSTLVIDNSNIMDNSFDASNSGDGGGIYNRGGKIRMANTTLAGNRGEYGGGLYNDENGYVSMDKCVIRDHHLLTTYYAYGGGIYNLGRMSITNSTVSNNISEASTRSIIDNTKAYGGGIYNKGTLTIFNCTIAGNSSPSSTRNSDAYPESKGGGIYNASPGLIYIANSTVAFNTQTGGISGSSVFALNTIIACNKPYNAENPVKGRNNLQDSLPAKVFGDAKASLGDNGGPTQTIPLSAGGSAVGGGIRSAMVVWVVSSDTLYKPAFYSDSKWLVLDNQLPTSENDKVIEEPDQRGVKRRDPPSIGAYESDAAVVSVKSNPNGFNEGPIWLGALGRNRMIIHAPAPETYSIGLFDSKGEAVSRTELRMDAATGEFDLGGDHVPGVYLIRIRGARAGISAKVVLE